jgi:hypothetical protein
MSASKSGDRRLEPVRKSTIEGVSKWTIGPVGEHRAETIELGDVSENTMVLLHLKFSEFELRAVLSIQISEVGFQLSDE